MPCYYTGSREGDLALALKENQEQAQKRLTEMTASFCAACRVLEEHGLIPELPAGVRKQWKKHAKVDARRRKPR